MMSDIDLMMTGLLALAGVALVAILALRAWGGWLDYKKLELASRTAGGEPTPDTGATGGRIELADLKARVRKLEAIASGIDY